MASKCFLDQDVTADEWVKTAIEKGLNCVAVTDHNIGILVDEIKKAAESTGLIVFPSVEITCDPSKVHLLIIFDVDKTSADIRDFLVRADIKASDFGKQEAATSKSIFEIAELANKDGAIVIPAHIDEFNGLGSISIENLRKFFTLYNINAVQVVHKEFLNPLIQTKNNSELKVILNNYYNHPSPAIDDKTIKDWYTPVKYALENKLAILTFSDNPAGFKDSKHGLKGIGEQYTWIKMGEKPSLEGLRQAFLFSDYRVKNKFENPDVPYVMPFTWIKSISISKTTITDENVPLVVDFSPQLNTIIGGRGSGKSSILRFIRGVFNRMSELSELEEILRDQEDFYKKVTVKPVKGVLTDESVLVVEFVRNEELYKFTASNISSISSQTIQIDRLNNDREWEIVSDIGYIDFFEFEHYSQKQIYEIAQEPNALRERIDKGIEGLDRIKLNREITKKLFLEKSAAIRTTNELLSGSGKIETRIKDIASSITKLQQSGIAELLVAKEKFSQDDKIINDFSTSIKEKENLIETFVEGIDIPMINLSSFNENYRGQMNQYYSEVSSGIVKIKDELLKLKGAVNGLKRDFDESIEKSKWKIDFKMNESEYERRKLELEAEGIDAISSFEKLTKEKIVLEQELKEIYSKSSIRDKDVEERNNLQNLFMTQSKEITLKRYEFINRILTGDKVKVNIKQFRNRDEFENRFRKLIQRENFTFQADIDKLMDVCFKGNGEIKINEFRDKIINIHKSVDNGSALTGHFIKLIKGLNEAQIDEIELMLPEDEIEIQYKPASNGNFRSLSTASAGQKTTAILTFILSYGEVPLILDQPEDDLDNRLVYELIVDRLKQAKGKRQLIIVTHNANIPVNGDAEYIISMDTVSKKLKICQTGSVDDVLIKKEICDIMEGGEYAFDMRSKRYKLV